MTGHDAGVITINIAEADEIEREQARRQMHESYRTLLGHFRHESGHYYWDRLIRDRPVHSSFRQLFGDESQDYGAALERHHASGAPTGWQDRFISSYASSHPWEDWAETWAHYLHMTDTVETAQAFAISPGHGADDVIERQLFGVSEHDDGSHEGVGAFARLLREWVWLSLAINSMNRSMGMRDAYPFVLSREIGRKLRFVHDLVRAVR